MSLAKLFKNKDEESILGLVTGPDFDTQQSDSKTGETVLHFLVKFDFPGALKSFIQKTNRLDPERRPNLDAKDKEGQVKRTL